MHTLEEAAQECRRLDKILNIDTSGVQLAFSKRSVRRYGSCKCERTTAGWRPVKIFIADFLKDEDEAFWETVRHEYAHAAAAILTGENHGHDAVWKGICARVGCTGKAYAVSTKAAENAAALHAKYKVVCLKCGIESVYVRETKLLKRLKAHRGGIVCRRCGGTRFDVISLKRE